MPRADDYTLMWWADGFPTRVTPWDLAAEKDSTLRCYTTETTEEKLRPRYRVVRQGIIEFKEAGAQTLTLRPAESVKSGGIHLHALHRSSPPISGNIRIQ